ncbi:hypothetical protein GYMLUDRAFT_37170 [Collybiopsis luxurians FD-317 M1]|nr:hypothetical protein GYMLUDRAFT_37170 [Collybiopsis luxurians FD-317 M1]
MTATQTPPQYIAPIRPDNTYVWYPSYYYSPSWVATPSWTTTVTPTVVYTPLPPLTTSLPSYWTPWCHC